MGRRPSCPTYSLAYPHACIAWEVILVEEEQDLEEDDGLLGVEIKVEEW